MITCNDDYRTSLRSVLRKHPSHAVIAICCRVCATQFAAFSAQNVAICICEAKLICSDSHSETTHTNSLPFATFFVYPYRPYNHCTGRVVGFPLSGDLMPAALVTWLALWLLYLRVFDESVYRRNVLFFSFADTAAVSHNARTYIRIWRSEACAMLGEISELLKAKRGRRKTARASKLLRREERLAQLHWPLILKLFASNHRLR